MLESRKNPKPEKCFSKPQTPTNPLHTLLGGHATADTYTAAGLRSNIDAPRAAQDKPITIRPMSCQGYMSKGARIAPAATAKGKSRPSPSQLTCRSPTPRRIGPMTDNTNPRKKNQKMSSGGWLV